MGGWVPACGVLLTVCRPPDLRPRPASTARPPGRQGCCVGGLRVHWASSDFNKKILANPFISNRPPLPAQQACPAGGLCLPSSDNVGAGAGGSSSPAAAGCAPGRFLVDGLCKLW